MGQNAYEQGVSHALGIPAAVGTPDDLFWSPDMMKGYGRAWFDRKLSTDDIATLMHVDRSTVHEWRRKGWLAGHKTGTRKGWKKLVFWRHSLHDLAECCLHMTTRKRRDSAVEHTAWTRQEIETLQQGAQPEGRSRIACKVMRCRLRKHA